MRIVLSRKGFDSGYGRVASPILPDGRIVSLPIPAARSVTRYGDVRFDGHSMGQLVEQLTGNAVKSRNLAHLDPDLDPGALSRIDGWRPAFGQEKAAQKHLQNEGVGAGALFLFFGWLRQTEEVDGSLRYKRGAPDIHGLFGYLQVGEIVAVDHRIDMARAERPWLAAHPHVNAHAAEGNTIYLAADRLVIDGEDMGAAGGGLFRIYHDDLRLTAPGHSRSTWHLPEFFCLDPSAPTLSYHRDPTRWSKRKGGGWETRVVAKGQEFVLEADAGQVKAWLKTLLYHQAT